MAPFVCGAIRPNCGAINPVKDQKLPGGSSAGFPGLLPQAGQPTINYDKDQILPYGKFFSC